MPGSGKGTQAKLLEKYGLKQISTSELIKKSKDPVIIEYLEKDYPQGKLLSDELIFGLIEKEIPKYPEGYVFDGAVRTIPQAEYSVKKNIIDVVLFFSLEEEDAKKRCLKRKEGRTDDTPDGINKRFVEYYNKTKPVLEYLKKNLDFYEVDASPEIEKIHKEVLNILNLDD